jgi:PAS domain S-box-containing protein
MTLITHDTFRAIFDYAPVGMAHVGLDGAWLEVNQRVCEITGYSRDELLNSNWQEITHPEDLNGNLDALAKFISGEFQGFSFEKRYIRKDGVVIWVKISCSLVREEANQAPTCLITVIDDITEFKLAQERRLTAEEKWSKAFRQTPLSTVLFNLRDQRFLEVNDAFVTFTGYSRQETIGRTTGELHVFVDPAASREIIDAVVAGNHVRGWERPFRTKDGRTGSALFFADQIEIDGEPCIIGAALDITERKRLETELQELSGKLIKAQDEERRRLAAELTDSLGQSVTVINFEASQLARKAKDDYGPELHTLAAKIRDIAAGIEIVSQSLHPSGLDYTGLPWAIEGLCRQYTHLYGLQVAFKHEGIPSSLSADVALCLYRIVQEGLNNVVRHSRKREAWIELASDGPSIRLKLWDHGVGFDVDSVKAGLGLLTMRERCRRLNGRFAIHIQDGTRLEAQIPLANIEAGF